jgi:hypothetical protein
MKRKITAVAAALALLTPSAAFAGTDQKITVKGGQVGFDHSGDYLWASDTNPSHRYHVRAYLRWTNARGHTVFAHVTSAATDDEVAQTRLPLKEGTAVSLKACYVNFDGAVTRCSRFQPATA